MICCTFVLGNVAFSFAVSHYNTYETKASINKSGYNPTQGFAVGSTYAYSAKLSNDKTKAVLFRTNMNTGATKLLKNGDTSKEYATYLGHANDMTVCSINNKSHLFVTDAESGKANSNLYKIKIDGDKFYKVGKFAFKYNGSNIAITGVNIMAKTSREITFLCKNGYNYYIGTIGLNAKSGNINLTYKFNINVADALVNGKKVDKLTSYTRQSMCYSKGNLYVPLWGGSNTVNKNNCSIILIYRNVNTTTTGTIQADPNTSFRVTSATYSNFEIEGCGIRGGTSGGKLWFNTNRKHKTKGTQADGVHYFNGYSQ